MPITTPNRTTEPHSAIQKCNAITKARTSKMMQQKCKRLTQFKNRRYSPLTTSTKYEKMDPRRVIKRVNARSYKVKTMNRGTYIRN